MLIFPPQKQHNKSKSRHFSPGLNCLQKPKLAWEKYVGKSVRENPYLCLHISPRNAQVSGVIPAPCSDLATRTLAIATLGTDSLPNHTGDSQFCQCDELNKLLTLGVPVKLAAPNRHEFMKCQLGYGAD